MIEFSIAGRPISPNHDVLVIAEIGVNHDGSLARAIELVAHAKAAGADAVKLQIFEADRLMSGAAELAHYQKRVTNDPRAMLRELELTPGEIAGLVAEIERSGMIALATPFSVDDLDVIAALDLPAIKIASPDLVNLPLLRGAAALRKPLLLSTGAASMEEVSRTARWLRSAHARFALLHCISSYPTADSDANLCWITELSRLGVVAGYSDHTTQVAAGALAVAHGACIVEKHLTYNCAAPGPDHAASADPKAFREYVRLIRLAQSLRGSGGKRVLGCEQDVRRVSRQSLTARRDLPAGTRLTESDLTTMRPGTGICASRVDEVVGRTIGQPLKRGKLLQDEHLAGVNQHAA